MSMKMDEICGDEMLPSCTSSIRDEEVNENVAPLIAAGSSISCDTLIATAVPGPTQEKLNEEYCLEATKLILDLGKSVLMYYVV